MISTRMRKLFSNRKVVLFHLLNISLIFYFIFHSFVGNRGVIAYLNLSKHIEQSTKTLDELKSERISLNYKVDSLKQVIDLDMLDQEARESLGFAASNEKIRNYSEEKE